MSGRPDVTVKEAIEKRKSAEAAIAQIIADYVESTGLKVLGIDFGLGTGSVVLDVSFGD